MRDKPASIKPKPWYKTLPYRFAWWILSFYDVRPGDIVRRMYVGGEEAMRLAFGRSNGENIVKMWNNHWNKENPHAR